MMLVILVPVPFSIETLSWVSNGRKRVKNRNEGNYSPSRKRMLPAAPTPRLSLHQLLA
jgi:hypothetical protein